MHVANKRTGHKQNDVYDDASVRELAKILNMVVAIVAVVVFSWLSQRFRRQLTVLFGDLFSTLMVATFFAFLSDSVTPDTAKRFYGVVGLGRRFGDT